MQEAFTTSELIGYIALSVGSGAVVLYYYISLLAGMWFKRKRESQLQMMRDLHSNSGDNCG